MTPVPSQSNRSKASLIQVIYSAEMPFFSQSLGLNGFPLACGLPLLIARYTKNNKIQFLSIIEMQNRKRVSKSEDAQFKVIMVGMSGSGKSCLLTRYTKDIFLNEHTVTVGVEFASKVIKIDDKFNVKLQIWDTAGQQSFKSIIKSYYRNSSVVFLVYNIINQLSFRSLDSWLSQAREHAPANAMFVLIGTHLDQAEQARQVSVQQAEQWMKEKGCSLFFQTSSKTSENVAKAFDEVAKQLFYLRMVQTSRASTLTSLQKHIELNNKETKPQKKECCS